MGLREQEHAPYGHEKQAQENEVYDPNLGYEKHGQSDQQDEKSRGKIVLQIDQGDEQRHHQQGRKKRVDGVVDALLLLAEYGGQVQHKREFDHFRRLEGLSEQEHPAPRPHDRLTDSRNEGENRQDQRHGHDEGRRAPEKIEGYMCGGQQRHATQENPEQLTLEEVVGILEQSLGVVGGGGQQHGQPDAEHEDQNEYEKPVSARFSDSFQDCTTPTGSSMSTDSGSQTIPRGSKTVSRPWIPTSPSARSDGGGEPF